MIMSHRPDSNKESLVFYVETVWRWAQQLWLVSISPERKVMTSLNKHTL